MSTVKVRKDEPLERALRRFKKKMDKEGLLREIKKHEHYEKPSQRKRRKILKARQREKRYEES
ncbi:30S ribosomal protein S21 [bacterium]|nr:30S ribosomal protein S21 [bacterium]MCK4325981.1 30S ribosomal protein S21 [bacterium]MCK4436463.1 30S ribosomal protein S21 [bacterium]